MLDFGLNGRSGPNARCFVERPGKETEQGVAMLKTRMIQIHHRVLEKTLTRGNVNRFPSALMMVNKSQVYNNIFYLYVTSVIADGNGCFLLNSTIDDTSSQVEMLPRSPLTNIENLTECQSSCVDEGNCEFWTYEQAFKKCFLFNHEQPQNMTEETLSSTAILGPKECGKN